MSKITQLFCLCCFWTISLTAQNALEFQLTAPNDPTPYAETITQADMRAILSVLAADDMEGRETGTPGNTKAAAYIANQLAEIGIPKVDQLGGYFQDIAFTAELWEDIDLKINNKPFRHLWDFYAFANLNSNRAAQNISEVVFLGYGIDDPNYSDYKGKNVKGITIVNPSNPLGTMLDKDALLPIFQFIKRYTTLSCRFTRMCHFNRLSLFRGKIHAISAKI